MITLFSHTGGPNGWKVVIVLEALGLKYESKFLDFSTDEQKKPEHTRYNPNGRIPTIIDHDNNDFTLWESNTIIKYLVDRYDKENVLHFPTGSNESYLIDQWMTFQVSGQGPYYGQAIHFLRRHPVQVPTAIERYQKEVLRVISVLDGVLAEKEYLVGNKVTIADLSFVTWDLLLEYIIPKDSEYTQELAKFKNFARWNKALMNYPSVKKAIALRNEAMDVYGTSSVQK